MARLQVLALSFAALLPACATGVIGDNDGPGAGHGGISSNGLSLNKLSLNKLSLNKLSLNTLSLNGLSDDGFAGLTATADGREVLTYVARCAVAEGASLAADVDGVRHEFPGKLGLAPEWQDGPCDRSCQRWMSACLLAHGNALGIEVPISLRGHHPALAATDDERADYAVQEGAFYGNLFDPLWGQEFPMFICSGDDMARLFDDPQTWLKKRLCGIWNECPIVASGSCRTAVDASGPACERHDGGLHSRCRSAAGISLVDGEVDLTGEPPVAEDFVYDEVITVYLQR